LVRKSRTVKVCDLFAGAGGTSTGVRNACSDLGLELRLLAINHWDIAIATHSANHPEADHICSTIESVDPRQVVPSGHLDLLVASPECIHHSRARGGRPINDQSRASAWRIVEWASALRIDSLLIENVPEFLTYGPLGSNGRPLQSRKGETFHAFINALRSLGYRVEWRVLNAANYGDPTTRERLFIQANRGRRPIRWPEVTHSREGHETLFGSMNRWRSAREIIDWSIPGESIFKRKRPLAPNTMARIVAGLKRFNGIDFIVPQLSGGRVRSVDEPLPTITGTSTGVGLCRPFLVRFNGEREGQAPRVHSIDEPVPTLDTRNRFALAEPFIIPTNHGKGDLRSHDIERPMPTITSVDAWALIEPFLVEFYGNGGARSVESPLPTVTTKDRFGLVEGAALDIKFRMLQPHELAAAMSFPRDYEFKGTREQRVKQIGNAVAVGISTALARTILEKAA
jgi:DNA (cytosine-5)-methyltransferase 1